MPKLAITSLDTMVPSRTVGPESDLRHDFLGTEKSLVNLIIGGSIAKPQNNGTHHGQIEPSVTPLAFGRSSLTSKTRADMDGLTKIYPLQSTQTGTSKDPS